MPHKGREYRRRILSLAEELHQSGLMSRYTFAPPAFRLLWLLGLRVPPPVYLRFTTIVFSFGTWFGAGMGLSMWVFLRVAGRFLPPLGEALRRVGWSVDALMGFLAVVAGAWFGIQMAWYYEDCRERLQLPPVEAPGAA